MAFLGNKMMATGILKGLGLDVGELAKAQDAWLDLPNTSSLKFEAKFSEREMQRLEKAAAASGTTAQKLLDGEFQKLSKRPVNNRQKPLYHAPSFGS